MTTHIAALGAVLADETRVQILSLLMDGRAHTGGELARQIGVSPSTVSEHLSKLLDAHMVVVEAQGRHRYVRLASRDVAALLETMGAVRFGPGMPAPKAPTALLFARTCYDHLAGRLAVVIFDQMLLDQHLDNDEGQLRITSSGARAFEALGIDVEAARSSRRETVRCCLDWTQRRHHLAGSLAAAFLDTCLERRLLARGLSPRSIRVTERGRREFQQHLGITPRCAAEHPS